VLERGGIVGSDGMLSSPITFQASGAIVRIGAAETGRRACNTRESSTRPVTI